jgi:L-asparaginase/Glu-tRNA(Gln) amidotransferase subunit D
MENESQNNFSQSTGRPALDDMQRFHADGHATMGAALHFARDQRTSGRGVLTQYTR